MPKAWMLVDVETGAVINAGDEHEALPPASTTKVLTALVAVHMLPTDADIPVSPRAEATPATKINMKAGQTWTLDDTLHALLMSSANDAAVALAERVSGSVEAFQSDLYDEAARLNMADNPVLLDPAGLDDSFSVGGGNKISASDLAIAARALLADPELSGIVAENIARFTGGDGIAHRLVNHNNMIRHYEGAIGVKTGWTVKAGHCLIAAARRNGRTMLSVVMDAPDMYATSAALLDQGFNTPVGTESTMTHLPPVPSDSPHAAKAKAKAKPKAKPKAAANNSASNAVPSGAAALTTPVEASARHSGRWGNLLINVIGAIALVLALVRARVRWVRKKRRHARLGHTPTRPKVRAPRPLRAPLPTPEPRRPEPRPQPKARPTFKPAPKPQPAPAPVVIQPAAGLWEGRTLEEWDRPLVSQ
jgi:serine-type D-Ala-D-Ala carboxypeptidase (penicillin-binding protein 5/6)